MTAIRGLYEVKICKKPYLILLLFSLVSNNFASYGRRHLKLFTYTYSIILFYFLFNKVDKKKNYSPTDMFLRNPVGC